MSKAIYFFGAGQADGQGSMKELLGGKGAGLAEMTRLGIPVPPGFTITTEVCNTFYAAGGELPAALKDEVRASLDRPEEQFVRGPLSLFSKGREHDDSAAFVVEDGKYVSARWPGDAYLLAKRLMARL